MVLIQIIWMFLFLPSEWQERQHGTKSVQLSIICAMVLKNGRYKSAMVLYIYKIKTNLYQQNGLVHLDQLIFKTLVYGWLWIAI